MNVPHGIALDAVVDYVFWVHPYDQKKSEANESAFSDVPEAKDLLEKVISIDSSMAAAGEVLGRRFPNLFALDRPWAKENGLCAGIRRDAIKERVSVVVVVRLDSAECATTNSRKS